jgi:hypothetical protein
MDRTAYPITDEEWGRLQVVFPGGVSDWSRPGVGQVLLEGA